MPWREVLDVYELLDTPTVTGEQVAVYLREVGATDVTVQHAEGARGYTDFVKVKIPGSEGKTAGGTARTLGVIGRLGGIGARPVVLGLVSDADGALISLTVAAKLARMRCSGDRLRGDVIISTHICSHAQILPHEPVPFMVSPVGMDEMNLRDVDRTMDAILSADTSRGNRIVNVRGIAISPTVKEGYILRVSEDLIEIFQHVTGCLPVVLPITTQDITPYGNGLFHVNSILQPSTATTAPVVGLATVSQAAVPGSATGATQVPDVETAARFALEVAKGFGADTCHFFDTEEFARIRELYGDMAHLQTQGHTSRSSG